MLKKSPAFPGPKRSTFPPNKRPPPLGSPGYGPGAYHYNNLLLNNSVDLLTVSCFFIHLQKAVGFKGTFDDFARTLELDKVKGDINVLSFNNTRTSSLLTKNSVMQSLFKSRYIEGFANYLPLKVTADNIKRLVLTHKVFCTMGPGDEDCVAASFGLAVKLIFGLTYYFYYHSASHSFDDLLAHHRKHSQHLVSLSRGNHSKNVAFFSVIPIQYGTPGHLEDLRAVLGERAEVLFNEEEIIVESDLSLNNVMFTSNL